LERIQNVVDYDLLGGLINMNSWIPSNSVFKDERVLTFDDDASLEYIKSGFHIQGSEVKNDDVITAFRYRQILLGDYLRKTDMVSMMNGVELRVPLLDEDLTNYAFTIPFDQKSRSNSTKIMLRRIHKELYNGIGNKAKKAGFRIPLDKYLTDDQKNEIKEVIIGCDHPFFLRHVNGSWVKYMMEVFLGQRQTHTVSRGGVYQKVILLYSLCTWLRDN
jgi:asparagine synthase (glutamine-hydrolysing)